MKKLVPALLLLTAFSCSSKKNMAPNMNKSMDLLERACAIEFSRHPGNPDPTAFAFFNNEAMDRYAEDPGHPKDLWQYLQAQDGICRGALVQLFTRVHPQYMRTQWKELTPNLSLEDKKNMVHMIGYISDKQLRRLLYEDFMAPGQEKTLREMTALKTEKLQDPRAPKLVEKIIRQEQDPDVLNSLLLGLSSGNLSGYTAALQSHFNHPSASVHRRIMMLWSTSELQEKKILIGRYREHALEEVRQEAGEFLDMLGEKEKLELAVTINGSPIGRKNKNEGVRSLIEATGRGDWASAVTALKQGADPNPVLENGTPLLQRIICEFGRISEFNWRRNEVGNQENSQSYQEWRIQQLEQFAQFLEQWKAMGLKLNTMDSTGRTAIFHAAMLNQYKVIEKLIALGADPSIADQNGQTPQEIAAMMGMEAAEQLLKKHFLSLSGR